MIPREEFQLMNRLYQAICRDHRGKMEEMQSLSTACRMNRYCRERVKNGNSVCAKCFAMRQTAYQKTLEAKLERNFELLTTQIIDQKYWPELNTLYFRLESFGDLENTIQLTNYFNFCNANPATTFALWTKNIHILRELRENGGIKPRNLIIVESAPIINKAIKPSDEWVDKVFVVLDKSHKGDPCVNCRKGDGTDKKCIRCLNCYKLDGPNVIYEIVK